MKYVVTNKNGFENHISVFHIKDQVEKGKIKDVKIQNGVIVGYRIVTKGEKDDDESMD